MCGPSHPPHCMAPRPLPAVLHIGGRDLCFHGLDRPCGMGGSRSDGLPTHPAATADLVWCPSGFGPLQLLLLRLGLGACVRQGIYYVHLACVNSGSGTNSSELGYEVEVRGLWHLLLWHIMKCNNMKFGAWSLDMSSCMAYWMYL